MPDTNAPEVLMAGGITSSSKIPPFHLIPTNAMIRIALRFELGQERKGDKAWNALSDNQACLSHREYVLERIGHVICHALKLRDKVANGCPLDGDDDAAAIAWSGIFLCEATTALDKARIVAVEAKKAKGTGQ